MIHPSEIFRVVESALLGMMCLFAAPASGAEKSYSPDEPGRFEVRTLDFPDLKDSARGNRNVPMKVHFPSEMGTFPLMVVSHGGGGNRDSYVYLAKHLASHGYVVICAEHVFSNNRRVRYYMSRRGGRMRYTEALFKTTRDPKAMLERPRDIRFAIDRAVSWNETHPHLRKKIDTSRIGVTGHSYGAYTTLVVCGARPILDYLEPRVPPGKGLHGDLSDSRVTFGFAMSPQPPGGTYFGGDSYRTIDRPVVGISGSKDSWKTYDDRPMPPRKRWGFWRRLPKGKKYFLWLENADHLAFADNPKAWILPSRARKDVQRICRAFMVLFSDYFLKDSREALACLNQAYADSLCGRVVNKIQWLQK